MAEPVGPWQLVRGTSDNPMTLGGTNTWVVGGAGSTDEPPAVLVVDPGFSSADHLRDLTPGWRVAGVVLTHRHGDHSELAAELAAATGAPVLSADPGLASGAPLVGGEILTVPGASLTVIATPGHTDDSLCFVVRAGGEPLAVLTGDTLLGASSTVVDVEGGGGWGSYLDALAILESFGSIRGLPGHGPIIEDVAAWAAEQGVHKRARIEQVRALLEFGTTPNVEAIIDRLYPDCAPDLRRGARISVTSILRYLDVD